MILHWKSNCNLQSLAIAGLLLTIVPWFAACQRLDQKDRPNIILIMSDDMGYSDLGCYGGEIQTPHLDQLAANGLQFTRFYNGARCCPTRASLMTGLYPHQTGIGHMTNVPGDPSHHNYGLPGYQGFLQANTNTIAEVLKGAGYHTLMCGKWHLGMSDTAMWPLQRGFEKFYGILAGACNYFKPEGLRGITYQNDRIVINNEDYYTTDAFTNKAIGFIEEAAADGSPYFLYLAYNAPHWPLNAPQEDIDKYRVRYVNGWQKLREERYHRMQEMGLIDSGWQLSPQDSPNWDTLSDELREEMSLRMAIYAAQVDRMDQNIGRLVDYLRSKDDLDNTLIMFLNDNGACAEGGTFGGGPKSQLQTREGYFLSYGKSWANASNTPYREYKHYVHEGGIATPLIVHWPAGIDATRKGSRINQYAFLPDVMATFKQVAQADYPLKKQGMEIPPLVGMSLLPLITDYEPMDNERPLFWEHEGNKAVRLGDYKLVSKWNNEGSQHWELYNVKEDRTELHDLSEEMPEEKEKLQAMWGRWANQHQVEPWDKILSIVKSKQSEE